MGNSTKQIREHIIRQIQVVLSESLQDVGSGTMRILGDIPNSILDPEDYLKSIHPFVSEIKEYLQKLHLENKTCLVAVKICRPKHSYYNRP